VEKECEGEEGIVVFLNVIYWHTPDWTRKAIKMVM
jgi:hypothetical protein